MRVFGLLLVVFGLLFMVPRAAEAAVEERIDVSSQRMRVVVDGRYTYEWAVSTGRRGYDTPRGAWRPQALHAKYYSRKYHNSPMPHSIFFTGGVAIHGTYETRNLGRPASHGCVRLAPQHAAVLYGLVRSHGLNNARIVVYD